MIPGVGHLLVVGIVLRQSQQVLLREVQVVEFILEDDARLEQRLLDDGVAGLLLLVGEGDLGQIVLSVVRVVSQAVGLGGLGGIRGFRIVRGLWIIRILCAFCLFLILCALWGIPAEIHHRLVEALPVVGILAPAPQSLEGGLSLVDGRGIIEVPLPVAAGRGGCRGCRLIAVAHGGVFLLHLLGGLLQFGVAGFLLFLFQFGDDAVDGF